MDAKKDTDAIAADLIRWRREFHAYPEIGFAVEKTAGAVADHLRSWNIPVQTRVGRTGVVGELRCRGAAPTVALRAELDALPVDEQTDLPYRSRAPGQAHACGHDGHLAMVLGAARLLAERASELSTNVKFIFQPSEEQFPGGAAGMIAEGVLDGVDEVFSLHVTPTLPTGMFTIGDGTLLAAAANFKIVIRGRGGHAGMPQLSIDPVVVAAEVVLALQTIVARKVDPFDSAIVTVGRVAAGSAPNVIPDQAEIEGTYRSLQNDVLPLLRAEIERLAQQIAAAHGATAEVHFIDGYPAVVNDPRAATWARAQVSTLWGDEALAPFRPRLACDDFAYFLEARPGAFISLGCGRPDVDSNYPNHHPRFQLDEACLPIGAALLVQMALASQRFADS